MQDAIAHLQRSAATPLRRPFTAATHDYAPLVQRAIANARQSFAADIAAQLLPVVTSLPWLYHYTPRSANEDLSERIAFAELIGPDGPMHAPHCRVGFTVMAERTTYPMHSHPAVELYLVLSGVARWLTPASDRFVPPGEFVLHGSDESHEMRTYDEPLLALWSWSGNIDAPAAYV